MKSNILQSQQPSPYSQGGHAVHPQSGTTNTKNPYVGGGFSGGLPSNPSTALPSGQSPRALSWEEGDKVTLSCTCKGPRFLDDPHQKDCHLGTK